jgi:TatD DNase family protein
MIDTHAHIYSSKFDEDRESVINRAFSSGVEYILLPNIDVESINSMLDITRDYANCIPMMGLHPCSVNTDFDSQLKKIESELFENPNKYIAVGEIGIDLYWDKTYVKEQIDVFRVQIQWAKNLQLPIAIHARDSFKEIFQVLNEEHNDNLTGVFHCFSGNTDEAKQALSYEGFKLGIGGVVTFKKSTLPSVLESIDLKNLVLETDSPYLAPRPFRGKRNESMYLTYIVKKLAEIYKIEEREIVKRTSLNAKELFKLDEFLRNE